MNQSIKDKYVKYVKGAVMVIIIVGLIMSLHYLDFHYLFDKIYSSLG